MICKSSQCNRPVFRSQGGGAHAVPIIQSSTCCDQRFYRCKLAIVDGQMEGGGHILSRQVRTSGERQSLPRFNPTAAVNHATYPAFGIYRCLGLDQHLDNVCASIGRGNVKWGPPSLLNQVEMINLGHSRHLQGRLPLELYGESEGEGARTNKHSLPIRPRCISHRPEPSANSPPQQHSPFLRRGRGLPWRARAGHAQSLVFPRCRRTQWTQNWKTCIITVCNFAHLQLACEGPCCGQLSPSSRGCLQSDHTPPLLPLWPPLPTPLLGLRPYPVHDVMVLVCQTLYLEYCTQTTAQSSWLISL